MFHIKGNKSKCSFFQLNSGKRSKAESAVKLVLRLPVLDKKCFNISSFWYNSISFVDLYAFKSPFIF